MFQKEKEKKKKTETTTKNKTAQREVKDWNKTLQDNLNISRLFKTSNTSVTRTIKLLVNNFNKRKGDRNCGLVPKFLRARHKRKPLRIILSNS